MNTADKIVSFCQRPRTAIEIAEHCGLVKSGIYNQLGSLQRAGKLLKLSDHTRRGSPSTFVSVYQAPSAQNHENLALTCAHNPFGLSHDLK